MPFQDYNKFIELCDKSSIEDIAKLAYSNLQNLTLTDMNVLDPNEKLGNLQLMTITSWMSHEEVRAEDVKRVLEKEEK